MLTIDWWPLLSVALYISSFFSLSLFFGLKAHQKKLIPDNFLYMGGLAICLVICYSQFYIFAISPKLGHVTTILFILAGLAVLPFLLRTLLIQKTIWQITKKYFFVPFLIIVLLTFLYSYFLFGCTTSKYTIDQWGEVQNPAFCHISKLPIDNALPYIYSEKVKNNDAKSLVIDWSIADRPPLQIATTLPISDLAKTTGRPQRYAMYYVFSITLQLSWIAVIWGILTKLLQRKLHVWGSMLALSATGFLYINSVFVWPKLISASLFVFGAFILFETSTKRRNLFTYKYLTLAAISFALALLSHTGVLFTLIVLAPLVAFDLWRSQKIDQKLLKSLIVPTAAALILLVPWQITKNHLISHDRLIKWHFAGVISAEDQRGTLKTIVDEYKKLPLAAWAHNKQKNIEALFTGGVGNSCDSAIRRTLDDCHVAVWRDREFFSSFYSLGLFSIGFPVIIWLGLKKKLDRLDIMLLLLTVLYFIVWVLLMFIPGATVIHQGSYASALFLFILLIKNLSLMPDAAFIAFVVLQLTIFGLAWLRPFGFL